MAVDTKIRDLATLPLFRSSQVNRLSELASVGDEVRLQPGTQVARALDDDRHLFTIEEGQVAIGRPGGPAIELGPGDAFTESGLAEMAGPDGRAVAVTPATVFLVRRAYFPVVGAVPRLFLNSLSTGGF
jgi:CRP-like cAMP-binding protein